MSEKIHCSGVDKVLKESRFNAVLSFTDPDISSKSDILPDADPTVFLKRYLKKIRDLGEVSQGMPRDRWEAAL